MNALSIPVVAMAGISFYVGLYHLLIYFRRRQHREDLTFALLCLATALYDVFCIGLYNATAVAESVRWQRAQFIALAFFTTAFLWFVSDYTHQKPSIATYVFSAFYLLAIFIQIVDRSGLTWMVDHPSVKEVLLPLGLKITYHEATFGPFTTVQSLTGMVASTYILLSGIRFYRRGYKREAGPLLLAMGFMYAAAFNDTAVGNGLYQFAYTIEYGYMAMILLMAYSLSNTVVEAAMAKEALRASEERFRTLVETTSDWVWEIDPNSVYTYASPKVRELLGYEPEEIIGKAPFDLMPPDEAKHIGATFQEIVTGHKVFARLENTAQHKDGRLVVLETSGVPFFDANKNLLGYRGIDRDVTERKRAEQVVRESEEKYRSLFESSPESITLIGLDGAILDCNAATAEIAGLPRDKIIGRQFLEMSVLDERELPQYLELFARVLGGEVIGPLQLKTVGEDRDTHWLEVFPALLKKDNAVYAIQIISRDITERKQAEEALRQANLVVENSPVVRRLEACPLNWCPGM
jgi:PAS domain S-box-containing protein